MDDPAEIVLVPIAITKQPGTFAGKISVITETWRYTYDADDLRAKATNGHNTYEYTYDGGKLTSMKVDEKVLWVILVRSTIFSQR